jgi:Fimbrial assembly protein (PilN)
MNGVNLIPTHRRIARHRRRALRGWAATVAGWGGLVVAACVATHFSMGSNYDAVASELADTRQRNIELSSRLHELRRGLTQLNAVRDTALAIRDHPDWSLLLALLGRTTGEQIVLRNISLKPHASAPSAPLVLQLRGFTDSQAAASQFVLRLQQLGLFDEVKLLRTGREPILNASAVTFEITATILPDGRQP